MKDRTCLARKEAVGVTRTALMACVEDFSEQNEVANSTIDWSLQEAKRLKGLAAATEYRLLFENLLEFIQADQPSFQRVELTVEYLDDKVGALQFRQASGALAAEHNLDLRKAKTMLRRAVAVSCHGKEMLSQLEQGKISVPDAETAITAMLGIRMPLVEAQEQDTEGSDDLEQKIHDAREALMEEAEKAISDGSQGMDFERKIRKLREKHHPVSFEERAMKARTQRNLTIRSCADGMAMIQGYVPSHVAVILERAVAVMMRRMVANGTADGRSRNQLMADIFTDLIIDNPFLNEAKKDDFTSAATEPSHTASEGSDEGGELEGLPAGMGTHVVLNLTLEEFLILGGNVDEELEGKLPNISTELKEIAQENRRLASLTARKRREAIKRRKIKEEIKVLGSEHVLSPSDAAEFVAHLERMSLILTDQVTGYPLGTGRKTYRANSNLKLLTALRDQHCRAPGCRRPYFESEHDHTRTWADQQGGTDYGNLGYLCKEHHAAKTAGWITVVSRPDLGDGVMEFASSHSATKQTTYPANPIHPELWTEHQKYLEDSEEPPF